MNIRAWLWTLSLWSLEEGNSATLVHPDDLQAKKNAHSLVTVCVAHSPLSVSFVFHANYLLKSRSGVSYEQI